MTGIFHTEEGWHEKLEAQINHMSYPVCVFSVHFHSKFFFVDPVSKRRVQQMVLSVVNQLKPKPNNYSYNRIQFSEFC
jgi:hypothetical protein